MQFRPFRHYQGRPFEQSIRIVRQVKSTPGKFGLKIAKLAILGEPLCPIYVPYQAGRRSRDWLKIKVAGYPRRDRS